MLAFLLAGISVLGSSNLAELTGAMPIDDGYTNSARPAPHDWDGAKISVGAESGARHVGYLRFDIGRLPDYKVPRQVLFRREMPKTPVGKILRKALREEAR